MKNIASFLILITIGLMIGCGLTRLYDTTLLKPEVIERVVYNTKSVTKEVFVEVPVETIVEVPVEVVSEVIVQVPQKFKYFESLDEFKGWISGCALFTTGDCDDYAFAIQEMSYTAGYIMSVEKIENHMVNTFKIGNNFYIYDATRNKIIFYTPLD